MQDKNFYQKHQIEFGAKLYDIVKGRGYGGLLGKPRSGKTPSALYMCELTTSAIQNILILCPKGAIAGWEKFLSGELIDQSHLRAKGLLSDTPIVFTKNYTVTNYEQVGEIIGANTKRNPTKTPKLVMKLNRDNYDLVVIDESHNVGGYPKPKQRYKILDYFCATIPHVNLSGTMYTESHSQIFHQFQLGKFRPFPHTNFYKWFNDYGILTQKKIAGRLINNYDKCKEKLLDEVVKPFILPMTQEDAGIDSSLQAVDRLHYVELSQPLKDIINTITKDQIVDLPNGQTLVCDTVMKERVSIHQLEGGTIKVEEDYLDLGFREKVDYIKATFGDTDKVGIMSHFIGERNMLEKEFKNATIYSSTSASEGVDLSHLEHFVIYSNDYRGSKHIQRRERIINSNGSKSLVVHFILVKKALSEKIYKKVSKKLDFNNSTYERELL